MKFIYLKSALKFDTSDVYISIQIPCFGASVTIEPGRSLLTLCYHGLFEKKFSKYYKLIRLIWGKFKKENNNIS